MECWRWIRCVNQMIIDDVVEAFQAGHPWASDGAARTSSYFADALAGKVENISV